jgi:Lon-like protease
MSRSRTLERPGGFLGPLSVALVTVAALTVPMPYVEYLPGGATEIEPLVAITGTPTTDLDGATALLTVRLTRQPLANLVLVALDRDRSVLPAARVYPQNVDRQDHLAQERTRFARQFDVAAAVGARAAGFEFEITTEVVVLEVTPDGPSDGVLVPGDVLVAIDGLPLGSGAELAQRIEASSADRAVVLLVHHLGDGSLAREVRIVPASLTPGDPPRLGIAVQTAVDELRLPIGIALTPGLRIGGPSAGLMIGVTVYDLLADENLLAGRRVAGTGTLDVDGRVGPVGGVREKVLAALAEGYELVLVPAGSGEEAQRAAAGRIRVIEVATLDEALAALRG